MGYPMFVDIGTFYYDGEKVIRLDTPIKYDVLIALQGREYPALVRIWDNKEDEIFDNI